MKNDLDSFEPYEFERYAPGDNDVVFDMKYNGICHTDVQLVKNDLGFSQYPLVPGHELVGVVTQVGANVKGFQVGDHVGVGCMVDSCLECTFCKRGDEQYCKTGSTFTYGGMSTYGRAGPNGVLTKGGYSDKMVVHEHFAVKIPKDAPLERVAPLLCAGITMYDPLKHWNCKPGMRVGIMGLGGLGTMGVKFAAAMGATVTALSTSPNKKEEALKAGASYFVLTTDKDAMDAAAGSLDLILDTVSADHEIMPCVDGLLVTDGTFVAIGLCPAPMKLMTPPLLFGRKSVAGSLMGGMQMTQEMMDFACAKDIFPDVEVIGKDRIAGALKALDKKNDHMLRYVIDCSTFA